MNFVVTVAGNLEQPALEWDKHSEYRWLGLDEMSVLKENRAEGDELTSRLVFSALMFARSELPA